MPGRAGTSFTLIRRAPLLVMATSLTLVVGWSCREAVTLPVAGATHDLVPVDPHFLRLAADAPPYAALSASFYATRTEERGVAIYFQATPGAVDSTKFLDFRVPVGALATAPDGTAYADGDSVLITVTVTDPQRMIVTFEPSGLRFSAAVPAQMTLSFFDADADVNGDGLVDSTDTALKAQLTVWGQEMPGGPWTSLPTTLLLDAEQLVVGIPGFSGYAAAYRER
jgi:hypothetical protein